ncbi:MAG: outer membrane protein transport protein, partial [Duncaniella sp.]|nr:outer membrane protein transport protein [Duncaniella sp.]
VQVGVSFYTPYGSSIDWTKDWAGSVLSQSVDLKVFTIQPTVSWRIIPKLSIGAGLMISWGSVDLNKGLVTAASMDKMMGVTGMFEQGATPFNNTTPAAINLTGTSDVAVGVNVGAMYEINRQWNVGASFRTEMKMKVGAGSASVSYANAVAQNIIEKIVKIDQDNFKASMPCPWVLSLGTSYKPIESLILAFDARLTGWHAYKSLDVEFLDPDLARFNQYIEKKYSNSWCFSLGGQYSVTKRFDVRLGLMVDTTPVNDNYYNPETPGMTKIEPTVGLSFRPIPSLSIDLGFMYIHGCGKKGASVEYEDLIGKTMYGQLGPDMASQLGFSTTGKFTADYRLHAFAPSIGISYSF